MALTQTQLLIKGLELDGWPPVRISSTGKTAYTKYLPLKSGDHVQAFMFVGGNATLRMALEKPYITKAKAMPKKAALLIAKAQAAMAPANLLAELETH